ncbi:hypothetical protein C0J52_10602 [Blattella germanica]|nr:hypothetical protein C0J52_10602 [Blattella germanica]
MKKTTTSFGFSTEVAEFDGVELPLDIAADTDSVDDNEADDVVVTAAVLAVVTVVVVVPATVVVVEAAFGGSVTEELAELVTVELEALLVATVVVSASARNPSSSSMFGTITLVAPQMWVLLARYSAVIDRIVAVVKFVNSSQYSWGLHGSCLDPEVLLDVQDSNQNTLAVVQKYLELLFVEPAAGQELVAASRFPRFPYHNPKTFEICLYFGNAWEDEREDEEAFKKRLEFADREGGCGMR